MVSFKRMEWTERWWPPSGTQTELLGTLAQLIARGGAGHLLDAPVAAADAATFPDPWQPTAVATERLLRRLLWLAYVDLDVELDDRRRYEVSQRMLTQSEIEWVATVDGTASFKLDRIGNDNVAGLLAHEVGRAFVAWVERASPYREQPSSSPSLRTGSVAAIYLGLGVVAANAVHYHRTASRSVGRQWVTDTEIVTTGGLTVEETVYLLAIQAVLRDAPIPAHATLREDLAAHLRDAIDQLAPHREEIARRLELDLTAPRPALEREPAPPPVAADARPEPSPRQRCAGQRTYRIVQSRSLRGGWIGMAVAATTLVIDGLTLGLLNPVLFMPAFFGLPLLGSVVGGRWGHDVCVRCDGPLSAEATTCSGCGARIAGRVRYQYEVGVRELEQPD